MNATLPTVRELLEHSIRERTGKRVRDLSIEVKGERIILRGYAKSFHVKQLAQHGVLDLLPRAKLINAIEVSYGPEPYQPAPPMEVEEFAS